MAPPRPIGGFTLRKIFFGALIIAVFFSGTLWALNIFWPTGPIPNKKLVLAEVAALRPNTRTSVMTAPVAISLSAIRNALETAAPRNLAGKRGSPLSEALSKAEVGWSIGRGPIAVAGRPEGLTLSTPLTGTMRVSGQLAAQAGGLAGGIAGTLAGVVNPDIGRGIQEMATSALDQRAEIRGNVTITARPTLLSSWRLDPGLSGQVALADGNVTVAGFKINVLNEVKPFLDRAVSEQLGALQQQIRNDPFIEQAARREWAKICRSISLATAGSGAPRLWLEIRPTAAFAAQPRIDGNAVTLTLGVQAETRVVPTATKPNCPFPAQLQLAPPIAQGHVALAMPIDIPFSEANRILEAQLKGRKFPEDPDAVAEVTVLRAGLAPSGDRLLISLQVKAREKKSWFGLDAEATIYVWGRPELDRTQQMLRLTDIALDVESEAAFGLLGAATRAIIPLLKSSLQEHAAIDLKPFMAHARASITEAIADFQKQDDSVHADAAITGLRLVDIEFDSKILRVIAEAEGTVKVVVSKLPGK